MPLNPQPNSVDHSVKTMHHLLVCKTQEANPEFLDIPLSFAAFLQFAVVRETIDLNREEELWTEEIDHVLIYRFPSMKIVAEQLLPLQLVPKHNL
jgi:hypothetical protein